MAFDQVTWVPAIGGGGDNNYNVPGAAKLDGTVDTGNQQTTAAGTTSYSSTPTIAEINAGSGFNQVAALLNRRAQRYNTLFGTALSTVSYVAQGAKVKASDFTRLFSAINTVRQQEGFTSTLTWPISTPTAGKLIFGHQLAYLRKALAISGSMTLQLIPPSASAQSKYWTYTRTDNPYNTHVSESIAATGSAAIGKNFSGANSTRFRQIWSYAIPDWMTVAPTTAQLAVTFTAVTTTLESFTVQVYSYNSDPGTPSLGTGYNGTFYNPNSLEGTFAANTSAQTLNVGTTPITSNAGARYAILAATTLEYSNGGADPGAASKGSFASNGNGFNLQLTF